MGSKCLMEIFNRNFESNHTRATKIKGDRLLEKENLNNLERRGTPHM